MNEDGKILMLAHSNNWLWYDIGMSVLLENSPLLQFIKNFIGNSSGLFSISVLYNSQWYTEC